MTRPLRSAPITGASPLLRAGPPARTATGAEPVSPPPATQARPAATVSVRAFSRSVRARQVGFTSPPCRTPPAQSAGIRQAHPGSQQQDPGGLPPDLGHAMGVYAAIGSVAGVRLAS